MEIASSGGLQEVECPGAGDRLRAALHPQLATEVIDVSLHRVHTQHETAGDLTIRCSRKQQPQHLAFAFGQRFHKRIRARRGGRKSRCLLLTESGEQGGALALGRDLESFLLVELSRDKIVFVEEGLQEFLKLCAKGRGIAACLSAAHLAIDGQHHQQHDLQSVELGDVAQGMIEGLHDHLPCDIDFASEVGANKVGEHRQNHPEFEFVETDAGRYTDIERFDQPAHRDLYHDVSLLEHFIGDPLGFIAYHQGHGLDLAGMGTGRHDLIASLLERVDGGMG